MSPEQGGEGMPQPGRPICTCGETVPVHMGISHCKASPSPEPFTWVNSFWKAQLLIQASPLRGRSQCPSSVPPSLPMQTVTIIFTTTHWTNSPWRVCPRVTRAAPRQELSVLHLRVLALSMVPDTQRALSKCFFWTGFIGGAVERLWSWEPAVALTDSLRTCQLRDFGQTV